MANLSPFLFAQIDKIYLKMLSVKMNISNTNEHSSHETCEVLSGSNSKWSTYRHFCLLKLTKYMKMLSVQMNISNTNKYFFRYFTYAFFTILPWILWSFIIFVCSNWQNISKYCSSGWISPIPRNISSWYSTDALTTILLWILWSFVWIKIKMVDLLLFLLKLTKYLKILSVWMNISNTNEHFPILYTYITYNPLMNPVKFRQNQIQNGRLMNMVDEYRQHQ